MLLRHTCYDDEQVQEGRALLAVKRRQGAGGEEHRLLVGRERERERYLAKAAFSMAPSCQQLLEGAGWAYAFLMTNN